MPPVIVSIEIGEWGSCRSPAGTLPEERKNRVTTSIACTGEIFSEGGRYVGLCRELNVSSFGQVRRTPGIRYTKRSRRSWKDAICSGL